VHGSFLDDINALFLPPKTRPTRGIFPLILQAAMATKKRAKSVNGEML
jgi:hypothetical protein